uniref:Uncharacterized protein n=1 Tax=Anopheles atroparvus TaxID=41427 RepID=A0AAG5DLG9_ANOAO
MELSFARPPPCGKPARQAHCFRLFVIVLPPPPLPLPVPSPFRKKMPVPTVVNCSNGVFPGPNRFGECERSLFSSVVRWFAVAFLLFFPHSRSHTLPHIQRNRTVREQGFPSDRGNNWMKISETRSRTNACVRTRNGVCLPFVTDNLSAKTKIARTL